MSTGGDPRRVHFQSPAELVERLDAVAEIFDRDRTDLLIEAMREYVQEAAQSEEFRTLVAERYYGGDLDFEEVRRLVGTETAHRLRILKADLGDEPLDLPPPADVDVYDGERRSVIPEETDEGDR